MGNNLFIAYDFYKPEQPHDAVIEEIKNLGFSAKIHLSVWYVKSSLTAEQAKDRLRAKMGVDDKLLVVDTTNNTMSSFGVGKEVVKFIQEVWNK